MTQPEHLMSGQGTVPCPDTSYFLPPTSYLITEPDLPFRLCYHTFCNAIIPIQIKNVPSTIPANATGHFPCLLKP